jgi:undecaprenyl-diphosphatase
VSVNEYLLAALLGVIEGLTEFLPVSSTAHLRIVEALLGVDLADPYWKTFSIVIQLGAVLCLPIYFRHRLAAFAATFPRGARGDRTVLTHPLSLTALAFLATAIPSFLLRRIIGENLEDLRMMGISLVAGGVAMWIVDAVHGRTSPVGRTDDLDRMSPGQALWIGACQVLSAMFPGTSRSMVTITAGMTAGMTRPAALEFSFLLSLPTMAAATLFDLVRSLRHGGDPAGLGAIPPTLQAWMMLAIGFVVSFVVAYAVVAWFMAWVRTRGFAPFALYRVLVGAGVLWWAT